MVDGNNLEGSSGVPASWASMPRLSRVYLQPGNPGLCTQAPTGAAFKLCSNDDPFCRAGLQASDSPPGTCIDSTVGAARELEEGGSAAVPLAAIVTPIVASLAIAAAVAAAVFVRWRSRRRQHEQGKHLGAQGMLPAADGGAGAGSGAGAGGYPLAEYAFHAEVRCMLRCA